MLSWCKMFPKHQVISNVKNDAAIQCQISKALRTVMTILTVTLNYKGVRKAFRLLWPLTMGSIRDVYYLVFLSHWLSLVLEHNLETFKEMCDGFLLACLFVNLFWVHKCVWTHDSQWRPNDLIPWAISPAPREFLKNLNVFACNCWNISSSKI